MKTSVTSKKVRIKFNQLKSYVFYLDHHKLINSPTTSSWSFLSSKTRRSLAFVTCNFSNLSFSKSVMLKFLEDMDGKNEDSIKMVSFLYPNIGYVDGVWW